MEVFTNVIYDHEIDFPIYDMSKDKKLVEFIFCSFPKSATNKDFNLQDNLVILFWMMMFELVWLDESIWIDYLRNLNYDFGSALINILLQRTNGTLLHYTDSNR